MRNHHLVQVYRVVKRLHRGKLRRCHLGNANRTAELDFGNGYACLAQIMQGLGGVFKLHGTVADVEAHTQMLGQGLLSKFGGTRQGLCQFGYGLFTADMGLNKVGSLLGGFQVASWFGF